jgi:glycosyltransferase involved in cell wall biosynthesis
MAKNSPPRPGKARSAGKSQRKQAQSQTGSPAPRRARVSVLHLHSSFSPGGKEVRCVQLINAFGPGARHTVVSAEADQTGAMALVDSGLNVRLDTAFPSLAGKPTPARLKRLAAAMAGYDLICTYNWGAMDAVMAHTLFADIYKLPPLVHHEDGFNEDEAIRLKPTRNWYRRVALGRASALVVPSLTLQQIALETWSQPRSRVQRIPNGIDLAAYSRKAKKDAIPRVIKRKSEKWVGTLAGLRPVKDLTALVRAFAPLPEEWQLVILGEGPEREAIRAEADRLEIGYRVHLPGFVEEPARAIGLFDIFALSSRSEQFPVGVVEAMAAGLPVAAYGVGDIANMVAEENVPFITAGGDEKALAGALWSLSRSEEERRDIGAANKARAHGVYDADTMIAAYRSLYARVMGRSSFP